MSESQTLSAPKRDKVGSRHARSLRRAGRIPCSIQAALEAVHLDVSIDEAEFLAARRRHVHLFDLEVDGSTETALVRELQWDTFGDRIIHVEFKRVQRGVLTEIEVELEFVGQPQGGVVQHVVDHVLIEAMPSQIPDSLVVHVGDKSEGDVLRASDIRLPEGTKLAVDPDLVVATISGGRAEPEPSSEDEDEDEEPQGGVAPATPEED